MRQMTEFYCALKNSLNEQDTLVCYLDGLGYWMYQKALQEGTVPFIQKHFCIEPVCTVHPSLTNPGMATMITGKQPKIHGITSRKDRKLKVKTIFSEFKEVCVFLEGDTQILLTEVKPFLHTQKEGKTGDYWIFQDTLKAIYHGTHFIFAHFHEIDDAAHEHGPYSPAAMSQIQRMDEWIRELSNRFYGNIFLISDHGMHEEGKGGSHGTQCEEDMLAVWGEKGCFEDGKER